MSQKKIRKLKKQAVVQVLEAQEKLISVIDILKVNWKFLLGLCVGIFILYINSLNGAFVSDDYATIPQNPLINNFGLAVKGSFVALSNYFIYKIFGFGSPFPFHIFNLFLYLAVLVVGFVFIYMVTKDVLISQLTLVLFAVNPTHVEAVSWISGKPYLISAITVLTSLILFLKFIQSGATKYLWMLILFLPICFYSEKVRFFAFVLIAITYAISFNWGGKAKVNWGKLVIGCFVILGMASVVIYPFVIERVNTVNSGINSSGGLYYDPFFQYPTSIAKYLQLIFAPFDLTLYHTLYIFPVWLNRAILISYLSLVFYFWFKNKLIFFSLVFIFLATAPSMAPIEVSWLVAERYIFLGTLGYSLLLSIIFFKMAKYFKLVPGTIFLSIVIFSIVRTWTRNIDWQSNHNLWVNTCQVSPNSHNAWNNIGDDYDKLKEYENAIKGFTQSTIVKPNYADAFHNRGNIFFKVGRYDMARESYQSAIKYNPGLAQTYMSLIQVDMMDKRPEAALEDALMATKVMPDNPQTWYVLGVVQSQLGKNVEAQVSMQKSLRLVPDYKPAIDALVQLRSAT